jgi:hypothetical protein
MLKIKLKVHFYRKYSDLRKLISLLDEYDLMEIGSLCWRSLVIIL